MSRCCQGHGGFLLWSGVKENGVRRALSAVSSDDPSAGNVYSTTYLLNASKARCLELRQRHGSFLAPLGLMLYRGFDGLLKYKPITFLKINYARNPQFFTNVMPVPVYYRVRTAEDKVWELAHYISLSTDNYLWMVKFRDKNNKESAFMEKCRIRELYDKNSSQMKHYRDYLALDVQRCRFQLDKPEYKKAPALRQATLDLCSGIEKILSDWDRYREGKTDYKQFAADLKRDEANLEKLRYAVLSARWDYLYDLCGFDYYVMCLMVYEGAPEPLTVKLFEEK